MGEHPTVSSAVTWKPRPCPKCKSKDHFVTYLPEGIMPCTCQKPCSCQSFDAEGGAIGPGYWYCFCGAAGWIFPRDVIFAPAGAEKES